MSSSPAPAARARQPAPAARAAPAKICTDIHRPGSDVLRSRRPAPSSGALAADPWLYSRPMDIGQVAIAVAVVVAAYLIGAIPWGVVIARVTGGPDPRTIGSGRTGGANVMRALGPRAAAASGLLDVLKGAVAVLIAIAAGAGLWLEVLAAIAAIVGHSRSAFIGFSGGRGIAPGFGGLIVIHPVAALLTIPVFVVVFVLGRYSSLASLTATAFAAVVVVVSVFLSQLSPLYTVYAVAAGGLVWLFHLDNIRRLLDGTERRIDLRR
jgi:acyl phosphate:glycerol-3-phosphate acyltransferase